ncbi:tyrosine-type recombinase/integrase [Streptosporangium sp. NPDC048865]|uniref:tyrosine-type recombinase/integrase n=1 Tax=Streptosporangium sp. NPDC048865 TaxID=3155766 RepID=UPI00344A2DF4
MGTAQRACGGPGGLCAVGTGLKAACPASTAGAGPGDGAQRRRPFKQLLQLAEIDKNARVHDTRHTAATLLLEQGVDIRMVQAVFGHSRLTTTKRYTHITETLAIEAAGRMGRALWDE